MKKSIFVLALVTGYFMFSAASCDNGEDFTQIAPIESQIYNEIKYYRESHGQSGAFVHQYLMVKEAQLYSAKMAYTTMEVDISEIQPHWDIIHDKIGGYNDQALVQSTTDQTAAAILANWTADSASNQILLGDYTQCGVGVANDTANNVYVTVMLMKVDS